MPAKRITQLTPDQRATLPAIRDEWIAHGLSTAPADRAAAEQGIRDAYRAGGLEPPRFIIWVGSPYAGAWGQAVAPSVIQRVLRQVGSEVGSAVGSAVGSEVGSAVGSEVGSEVGSAVGSAVGSEVASEVGSAVSSAV